MRGRGLKQAVLNLLKADAFDASLSELCMLPARQVINPVFSFLVHSDEKLRWRAITAMGGIVENLAGRTWKALASLCAGSCGASTTSQAV